MFVHQLTINTLELKKDKGTDYVLSWISKRVYTSKLKPLYTAFLHRLGVKLDKGRFTVEQNNYVTKIVNAYIVYDLNAWPNNTLSNFKLKNCLFITTIIVKK